MTRKIVISASAIVMAASFTPVAHPAQLTGSVVEWGDAVIPLVDPQTRFKSIASGYEAAFGLTTDGQLIGWHWNFYHEIPPFGHATNIIAVSAATHTLALKSDGTVLAWGDNSQGQCDVPPGLSNVIAISATCGWYEGHSLALKSDGTVVAWGDNFCGESNIPDYATNIIAVAAGPCVSYLLRADGTAIYIASHTNAVINDLSNVVAIAPDMAAGPAWMVESDGSVRYSQIDTKAWAAGRLAFTNEAVAGVSNIVSVSGGSYGGVFFLQSDGTVLCRGLSQPVLTGAVAIDATRDGVLTALLADGSVVQSVGGAAPQPPDWSYMHEVSAISAGESGGVALKPDGTTVPAGLFPGPADITAVSAGYGFVLGLRTGGTVSAWGENSDGQCDVPAGLSNVVAIAAGGYHSLALKSDNSVVAWGYYAAPLAPDVLPGITEISGGAMHSLALSSNGTVFAWGDDSYGQCHVPYHLTNVIAVAAGGAHNLALKSDGTVVAWGYNNFGQTNVPAGLSNVIAVAAGGDHSLALKSDGTIVAWGSNTNGESTVPDGLGPAIAISAGFSDSMALVLPPAPTLTINSQPTASNQITLSWRTNYSGFALQSSASLNPPTWIDSTNPVAISNGHYTVTAAGSPGTQFFRLKK
jgi:alpha-tubulin suppressor-like RCC1 family protein